MKTPFWFIVFASLGAGATLSAQETMMDKSATPAPAASPAASAAAPAKPMSRTEEILRRFDKNGDGKLDDDEKADAHEAMLQEQMAKGANPASVRGLDAYQALGLEVFDRNRDGRIDEDERRDAFAFVQIRTDASIRESILKRFDKNQDGLLDDSERVASQAYLEEHRGELMHEVLVKRFDKNANGQLDADEKAAIRDAFAKFVPGAAVVEDGERPAVQKFLQGEGRELLRAELIKRFDANNNGQLDPDEQRAAQEYGREHRGEIFRALMLRRFDRNGDGQLDESERAAMREALERGISENGPPADESEVKKIDPARAAALAAEIERRRAQREARASSVPPASEEKK